MSAIAAGCVQRRFGSFDFLTHRPRSDSFAGSHAIYHGVLTNTGGAPINIVTFSFINPPADFMIPIFPFTEPAIPFTLQADGQFSGIVADIGVPANAQSKTHNFGVAAFSDQHNMAGDSIASNFVSGSLTALPEPASVFLVCGSLLSICIYQLRCLNALISPNRRYKRTVTGNVPHRQPRPFPIGSARLPSEILRAEFLRRSQRNNLPMRLGTIAPDDLGHP